MSRFYDAFYEQFEDQFWRRHGFSFDHFSDPEFITWAQNFLGRHYGATPPPGRGPKHAVRPPWAPSEPEPLEIPPALLPGLVDLAEQAGMLVEIQ